MTEQELEGTVSHQVQGWTRRAVAGVLAGCGLASMLGKEAEAKKKNKKKKKKGKGSPKPTPPTCKPTCGDRTCGGNALTGTCPAPHML